MPDWKLVLTRRLAQLRVDPTLHFPAIEELAQHLEDRHRSLIARGVSAAEAETSVLHELDGDELIARELERLERLRPSPPPALGDPPKANLVSHWREDLRYGARTLRQNLGFTAVAVLTLALGMGATTAIFSVVNAVMVRPLPFEQSDRLIRVWESNPAGGWPQFAHSYPNFLDWRAQQTRFEGLAAYSSTSFATPAAAGAELIRGLTATTDFLPLLRVTPAIGRNFTAAEDRPGGNTTVALLSEGFARRRFNDARAALGQTVLLNGRSFTIVGILPASFQWGTAPPDVLVPMAPDPARNRGDHRISVFGRLKNDATIEQAHAELAGIATALAAQYPDSNRGWSVRLATFYDWLIPQESRSSLLVLLGAVSLVFLIACGNVTSLLLARAAARQKEISIRVALGAARWRIVRQLLTESLLLALTAGVAGLGVAAAAMRLVVAFGPDGVPRLDEVSFDRNVLALAVAIAGLSAVIFGLVPAIHASREQSVSVLHESRGTTGGRARQRLRSVLTVAEVALSVALLIGAGLLFRSFGRLQDVKPGFDADQRMTLRLSLPGTFYPTGDHHRAFYSRLLDDVRSQPGMVAAATSSGVPLGGGNTSTGVVLLHRQAAAGEQLSADWRLVSPGYFAAMGIPLRGRDFAASDGEDTPPVTIISETMARRFWPGEDPLGRTVGLTSFGQKPLTIIGVAGDVRSDGFESDPAPMVYGSTLAFSGWNPMTLVWRSAADPASHVSAIREAVQRIDPAVPIYDIRTLNDMVAGSFGPRLFNLYALGIFAAVALILAAIGLFGVMAYLVVQRTREIGVRLALGANRQTIFRLVIGRGLVLTLTGAVIGVGAALGLTRLMQSLLFSVSATDPGTFVTVPLLLIIVAALACYVPARRAMRVDPVTALRAD